MDQLPLEIKHIIAQWAGEDKSNESLQALSQVNRQWNKIASSFLYRHLVIRLYSGKIPHKLLLSSDTRSVLKQVKTLSLVAEPYPARHRRLSCRFDDLPYVLEGVRLGELGSNAIHQVGSYKNGDWTLITDLIRQIPSLHNANLLVLNGGPVELFEAFSHYHPTCRVSIFTTWPSSSHQIINKNWALSPMLHAVHFTDCEDGERYRGHIEHPDQLLKRLILQSPQIKEASLQITGARTSNIPINHNQGIPVEEGSTPAAKLQTLLWPLHTKMTPGQFQEWQRVTDFRLLKAWTIGCVEDSALLQTIVDIHPFQHLTRLSLVLVEPKGDANNALEFWSAAESMFESLPPLTYLWLMGSYTPAFVNRGVLGKHGSTLLQLKLKQRPGTGTSQDIRMLKKKGPIAPVFSSDDISELARQCPSLQKLLICAQRSQGLGTDLWNAFGRLSSIEEIDLTLKCSPEMDANMMPVPPRELSAFEKGVVEYNPPCPRWFIRDCIINCSISESLTKALFMHIRACQDVKRFTHLVIRPLCTPVPGRDLWNHLALVWTMKVDALTGLHATSKQTSKSSVLTPGTNFGAEMISIFQSI